MKLKLKHKILHELKEHVPFTALATLISVVLFGILFGYVGKYTESLFEVFHPAHIFFSSIVSAAIFYKYRKNALYAVVVGGVLSLFMASVSDIIFPYLGSLIFNIPISFHLPLAEMPVLIIGITILGPLIGVWRRITKIPHFLHVFISVFASLLYLFAYGSSIKIILAFLIVFVSVIIPCCLGDIVFPLIFQYNIRK